MHPCIRTTPPDTASNGTEDLRGHNRLREVMRFNYLLAAVTTATTESAHP